MLYYFLYQLIFKQYGAANIESYLYKGLNVFQYITFRTAWATITALLISLLFGGKVIKKLSDLKIGQESAKNCPKNIRLKEELQPWAEFY